MYHIKNERNQSIKERLLCYGVETLSNIELLAVLLSSNTNESEAIQTAQHIINELSELAALNHFSSKECQSLTGIGPHRSAKLLAAIELGKRIATAEILAGTAITSSKSFAQRLMLDYRHIEQECVDLYCLNAQHTIIKKQNVFKGSVNRSIAEPREILSRALKELATAIIVVHNHPSGNVSPSIEDKRFTLRLKQACELVGIQLLDHFIVGYNQYYSFNEKNLI